MFFAVYDVLKTRGMAVFSPEDLAEQLGMEVEVVECCLADLWEAGFIGRHGDQRELSMIRKPQSPQQAFESALFLALIAPDKDMSARAFAVAKLIGEGMGITPTQLENAKAASLARADQYWADRDANCPHRDLPTGPEDFLMERPPSPVLCPRPHRR